jgi:cytochrome b
MPDMNRSIRVWDLPTRLFHWLLVAAIIGSFVSVKLGGNAMIWHGRFGFLVLTLLIFRLLWGFFGPTHARFKHFVKGPRAVMQTLRGQYPETIGHSPLGALSVLAILLLFLTQALLGLLTSDEIFYDGPFVRHVSNQTVEWATRLHRLNEWLLLGLIGLHLSAIGFYAWVKKKNLVGAMITGDKPLKDLDLKADLMANSDTNSDAKSDANSDKNVDVNSDDSWAMRARALFLFALAAAVVFYLSR